jgi:hypothetical protein
MTKTLEPPFKVSFATGYLLGTVMLIIFFPIGILILMRVNRAHKTFEREFRERLSAAPETTNQILDHRELLTNNSN